MALLDTVRSTIGRLAPRGWKSRPVPHLPPGCSRRAGGKRPWGVRERGRRGPLTQNVPLGSRVVSQKVNFLGQGNKGGSSRLPLGEERANILLLACCYQEGSNPGRKPGKGGPATSRFKVQGLRSSETSPKKMVKSKSKP